MVDEETLADAGARMNVVAGQETRKMVHGAGQEIKPRPIEAVRHPMEGKRPQARIEEDFGTRTRSRVAGFARIQIGEEIAQQGAPMLKPTNRNKRDKKRNITNNG